MYVLSMCIRIFLYAYMSGPAVSKLVFFAYPNNAFSFKNHVPLPCVFIGLIKKEEEEEEEEEEYTQVYIFL